MAQLKDLLVAGNARIIGESSFNKNITAKGNVTAAAFYGDGSHLTGFTANKALVSDNSGAISTRDITNLTASGGITASTNLVTANTLYYFTGTTNTTTVGTISSGIWQATVIGVSYGGTGTSTAPKQGGIIYGASTSAYGCINAGTKGQILVSGGTGAPTWHTPTSTNTKSAIVIRDANGNFSAGTITATLDGTAATANKVKSSLKINNKTYNGSTEIDVGTIGVGYGGTGTSTKPTKGGIIYASSDSAYASTAKGTQDYILKSNGESAPTWVSITSLGDSVYVKKAGDTMTGALKIKDAKTTASTSMTTGALVVSGGIGASGRVSAGSVAISDKATIEYNTTKNALRFVIS
jgi:hypothetical protein